ncbi:hypothetical protein Tco_0847549 [Tanacetum coccineum]
MSLWYSKDSRFELIAYADADHAGCNDDCKSTSGGIQFLGDKLVSWSSKKHDCTTMSSVEAEYIPIYCDSRSAIAISCNPVQHSRTKHINIRYHFIKEHVEKGTIELYFVGMEYQLVDLFTKALPKERRCNNYAVCQSIPCSPECKIVGQILLDHPLSYALTATVDVPVMYLQQFWRTVSKVPEDTIKFLLDTQQFTYIVDMFRDTLHLPVETPDTPFVASTNIHTIEAFMNRVGYQGVVDKLIIDDLMKKFPNIPKRLKEDYYSIKDGVPLVSVHTTGNVSFRWMLIPDAFLTAEIRETDDFKEYETMFMKVVVPMNQSQPVVSTQGTNRNTTRAPRTPTVSASPQESKKRKQTAGESSSRRIIIKKKKQNTPSIPPPGDDKERDEMAEATILSLTLHKTALDAKAKENIAKVQEMLAHEEIDKLVDSDEDDESSASAFADTVLNDNNDDTGSKLTTGSHKEHPKHVSDDNEKKKKDEEVEKENEVVVDMSGSHEIRKEQKQTSIPSTIRSPRNDLSSGKTISEEFTDTVTPTTATSSKTPSTTILTKTNEVIKQEMPSLVKLVVDKDREVYPVDISVMVSKEFATQAPKMIEEMFRQHMQNITLNLYPKSRSSTTTTSSADLQQQLYQTMKAKPQDQAVDPEIWESLKAKFKMP